MPFLYRLFFTIHTQTHTHTRCVIVFNFRVMHFIFISVIHTLLEKCLGNLIESVYTVK